MSVFGKNSVFKSPFLWIGLIFILLFKLKKNATSSEGGIFSGAFVDNDAIAGNYQGQTNTEIMLKLWVDDVVLHLQGYTILFYPEIVNRCTNFKCNELTYAIAYYNVKYKGSIGDNFYQFLNWESIAPLWMAGHPYEPAMTKIESCNLKNK